jgi:hypothetical protein
VSHCRAVVTARNATSGAASARRCASWLASMWCEGDAFLLGLNETGEPNRVCVVDVPDARDRAPLDGEMLGDAQQAEAIHFHVVKLQRRRFVGEAIQHGDPRGHAREGNHSGNERLARRIRIDRHFHHDIWREQATDLGGVARHPCGVIVRDDLLHR